jgi:hypothetical protein
MAAFDPENIHRYDIQQGKDNREMCRWGEGEWIAASDYDQLLALYREAKGEVAGCPNGRSHA